MCYACLGCVCGLLFIACLVASGYGGLHAVVVLVFGCFICVLCGGSLFWFCWVWCDYWLVVLIALGVYCDCVGACGLWLFVYVGFWCWCSALKLLLVSVVVCCVCWWAFPLALGLACCWVSVVG